MAQMIHLQSGLEHSMSKITEQEPATWQDLQNDTAQILEECGFNTEVETVVATARGNVELDVYAKEIVRGREYTTIVECKNWTSRVPQAIVHGFRTVVADIGANSGYIVSKAGFQAGCFDVIENTNIKLFTWEEFQLEFLDQWYRTFFMRQVEERLDPLCSYLEPFPAMTAWDAHSTNAEIEEMKTMYQKHSPLCSLIMSMHPVQEMMSNMNNINDIKVTLPLDERIGEYYNEFDQALLNTSGYREFLDLMDDHCTPILNQFREYRDLALARKAEEESNE